MTKLCEQLVLDLKIQSAFFQENRFNLLFGMANIDLAVSLQAHDKCRIRLRNLFLVWSILSHRF